MTSGVLRIALLAVLLSSCSLPLLPGDAAPIVKIGLIAPFEGLGRPLGYSVLPAVKIAIAEANASGELGRYRAALVALNDDGYPPSAVEQVKALAQDPDVMVALGPWGSDTAEAAATAFEQARLPGLVAAPIAGRAAGVASLCPSPQALAQALVTEAARLGGQGAAVDGPDNALARAIAAAGNVSATPPASRAAGVRLYTGDAAAAANDWLRWRAEGWTGLLLGGPDLARPWFPELIGRGDRVAGTHRRPRCLPRRQRRCRRKRPRAPCPMIWRTILQPPIRHRRGRRRTTRLGWHTPAPDY